MEVAAVGAAAASTGSKTMADLVMLAAEKHGDNTALRHKVGDDWVDLSYEDLGRAVREVTLGLIDYELNDKESALTDFRKALELDANIRRQFEMPANPQPGRGQRLRAIIDDKDFMRQLFPEKQ